MTDYDDLDTYNGDTENHMMADFDNYENTVSPDVFFAGASEKSVTMNTTTTICGGGRKLGARFF